MKRFIAAIFLAASSLLAQTNAAQPAETNPFKSLDFLAGTWEAKTQAGSASAAASATYTFQRELKGHVFARHTESYGACIGPAAFNCDHGDLLYVYTGAGTSTLKAIYFDNEGHVIHYQVSTPTPTTAIFISDNHEPGPQFRLVYELKDSILFGKFQIRMPGQVDWKSYLEWNGPKQK